MKMRAGRKPKAVEPKRTRSCVVRLEKVRTPPSKASGTKKVINQKSFNQKALSQNAASSSTGKINNNAVRAASIGINSKATKAAILIINPNNTKSTPNNAKSSPNIAKSSPHIAKSSPHIAKSSPNIVKSSPNIVKSSPNMVKSSPNIVKSSPNIAKISPNINLSKQQEEKKFKGPLKKRPLNSQTSSTPSPKVREKLVAPPTPVPRTPKQLPATPAQAKVVDTPTIAAGRSRRAIKPNPKYASDDIVTPKIIKHAAQLTPASNRKTIATAVAAVPLPVVSSSNSSATGKKRKDSTSSSEDLYNKDSSDAEYTGLNEILDENGSDSDFSDFDLTSTPPRIKNRGRLTLPQKGRQPQTPATPINVKTTLPKSTPTPKSLPSHLQQLRKSIAVANASRLNKAQPPSAGGQKSLPTVQQQGNALAKKRKIYESSNDSDSDSVAKRRKVYTGLNINKDLPSSTALPNALPLNHKTLMTRKSLTSNTTVNGSKITSVSTYKMEPNSLQPKRKVLLEKSVTNRPATKTLPTKTQNPIEPLKMSAKPSIKPTPTKARTASPASTPKPNKAPAKDEKSEAKIVDPTASSATVDDFETMPTFTIVNINDIINKKGDVLMTKAAGELSKSSSKDSESENSDAEDEPTEKEPIDIKATNRRKLAHNKILNEKSEAARDKKSSPIRNSSFTPPATKKPAQTILNHTLSNKNANNRPNPRTVRTPNSAKTTSLSNKPAPRILNSMVAKKTQPVKPLIANLDDSADEGFSIPPLDHDDDDDDDDLDATTDEEDSSAYLGKSRAFAAKKKSSPGVTKENSLAATNRQVLPTLKTAQRKISPEKVVISRQGDKIIKKITCFETWYIINLPDDHPAEVVRNQLEMPLIKLANAAKKVELPTSNWSSKVTLYQLAAGALSKCNYTTYTGDLHDQHIPEEDRGKYQPSCVMFRRAVTDRTKSRLPYDRAVIFKNKTFYTNIEGKNVKLVGAPFKITSLTEVEILLQLVDELTLQSAFVEQAATVQ